MHLTGSQFLTVLFLVISAGSSYVIARQLQITDTPNPPVASETLSPKDTAVAEAEPAFIKPPLTRFAAISEAPLFSPTRKPSRPPPPPKPKATPKTPPPAIVLKGVVKTPGSKIAIVILPKSQKLRRVAEQDKIDGWRVSRVMPDRIVLTSGDDHIEIPLAKRTEGQSNRTARRRPNRPIRNGRHP